MILKKQIKIFQRASARYGLYVSSWLLRWFPYGSVRVMKKILIPLPGYGFDPTEVAIPWKLLSKAGFEVVFATPKGKKASPDIKMLKGKDLGIWKPILQARQDAVDAYIEMESNQSFCKPLKYDDVREENFDALMLPGGHDKGVKEYLESEIPKEGEVHV